jgi:tetratricopeptide (TPR) repeat protein
LRLRPIYATGIVEDLGTYDGRGIVDSYVALDIIGALEYTDKSSCVQASWDYLRHYEMALKELRHAPINLIEVGVESGGSTRIWKWFFSQAQIIGIDINPACQKSAQDRVKIEIGSQIDGKFLDRVAAENPPTIIVDDGSHQNDHVIYTFERLFPKLLPGGIYIVEDIGGPQGPPTAASADPEAAAERDASTYFLEIARVMHGGRGRNEALKIPQRFIPMIDEITFIRRALLIRKRHVERDIPSAVEAAEAYLANHARPPIARDNLAAYIMKHNGPLAQAEAILQETIQTHGPTALRMLLLAENYLATGRKAEAAKAIAIAAGCKQGHHLVVARIARAQREVGDYAGALKTAEQALALRPTIYPALVDDLRKQVAEANAT